MSESRPYISLVIPVYDEAESLEQLHGELVSACTATGKSFEMLFVNDGSSDGSDQVLNQLARADGRVRVVHLRRNFGKSPALSAGFARARGDIIFTLDADLQDDPAMIPEFLAKLEAGADLVSGYKQRRHDPLEKRLPSKLFNGVVRSISGLQLHDFNCGFKAYRAECVRELDVYGGLHRFLPVLAHARGFRVEELVVEHRARQHGRSKFGAGRYAEGILDLLVVILVTRYRMRPARFFMIPGAALGLAGISMLFYLTLIWLLGEPIGTRPLLTLGVLLTSTSALFLCVGLLAELLIRTTLKPEEIYSVRSVQEGAAMPQLPAPDEALSQDEALARDAAQDTPELPTGQ